MPSFSSDGVAIAYREMGEGEPILLIHGFASNSGVNWVSTGWTDTLTRASRRVIAMDVRGHGDSDKLYDPALYRPRLMAADAASLLDHLGIASADVMGYSMGARIAAFMALDRGKKVRSLVFGGMGMNLVAGIGGEQEIAAALEADAGDDRTSRVGHGYRVFAEWTGGDLRALAACMRAQRERMSAGRLATIRVPVLVAVGTEDRIAGSALELARLIPAGEAFEIVDRDHMLATGDTRFKAAVLGFLERRP